jgi:hypothetical protein
MFVLSFHDNLPLHDELLRVEKRSDALEDYSLRFEII